MWSNTQITGKAFFLLSNNNAQEVITTAGDYYLASSGSLSWTFGETITETFSTGINALTQGFNQSQLSATATYQLPTLDFNIKAYPNPLPSPSNSEGITLL